MHTMTLRKFRALRDSGWTQAQAAEWYGVTERTWRRWENTGNAPKPVLKRITEWARRRGDPIHRWIMETL